MKDEADEMLEIFNAMLDADGVATSVADDGIVVAFTKAKLEELIKLAKENDDGKIVIFIQNGEAGEDVILN